MVLRSLCETLRAQRRRASLSLSSLSPSTNGSSGSASIGGSTDASSTVSSGGPSMSTPDVADVEHKGETGVLNYLVKEVDQLVRGSAWFQLDFSQCEQCGRSPNDLLQLESELHLTQEAADRLQRNLAEKTEEARRREEEAVSFKNQVLFDSLKVSGE